MPVSTPIHLPHCLSLIVGLQPRSVLDIGLGFGTWGFLCRTHLDVFPGRVQPKDWITRIDGVELFEPYIQAHQRALYNTIHIADVREAARNIGHYDLIIAGDVIEHLDKDDAEEVLDLLYAKADRALMVNIPIGAEGWEHGENHGNPGELHRSAWSVLDFQAYPNHHQPFTLPNGDYGVFWCPKDVSASDRLNCLVAAAHHALSEGRSGRALALARAANELDPRDNLVALMLADLAIQHGDPEEALRVLAGSLSSEPEAHARYLLLAQLHDRLGKHESARATLQGLLGLEKLAVETRVMAEELCSRLERFG
jgi:predicted Zn-dependent protease